VKPLGIAAAALGVVAFVAGTARAKIVIMEPPLVRACEAAPTLPKLHDCLKEHGLVASELRSLDDAKLFAVSRREPPSREVEAYVMYVHGAKGWTIGGMIESGAVADSASVLRLEKVTLGKRSGYRFDIASSVHSAVSLDQMTSTSAVYRQVQAAFCGGQSYSCTVLVPSCALIVFGQTYQVFDGTLVLGDNKVAITGAGSSNACSAAGEYMIGF
jgi:hypothetical protein